MVVEMVVVKAVSLVAQKAVKWADRMVLSLVEQKAAYLVWKMADRSVP